MFHVYYTILYCTVVETKMWGTVMGDKEIKIQPDGSILTSLAFLLTFKWRHAMMKYLLSTNDLLQLISRCVITELNLTSD